jgi:hypothetical protein
MRLNKLIFLSVLTTNVFADPSCQIPEGKSAGMPLITVDPQIVSNIKSDDCVLVSFKLVDMPGSNGNGLVTDSIKIEYSTNHALSDSVLYAVSKWKYRTKEHKPGDMLYFSYKPVSNELCQKQKKFYAEVVSGKCITSSNDKTGKTECASGSKLEAAKKAAEKNYKIACHL